MDDIEWNFNSFNWNGFSKDGAEPLWRKQETMQARKLVMEQWFILWGALRIIPQMVRKNLLFPKQ